MSDKMMRMAGRNKEGLAKPIQLSDNDILLTQKEGKILMDEIGSGSGRLIRPGEKWESDIFFVGGLDTLHFRFAFDKGLHYEAVIENRITNSTIPVYDTNLIVPKEYNVGSTQGQYNLRTPYIRLTLENASSNDINFGAYLYAK